MSEADILERALKLRPEARVAVVEGLLRSLDVPDPDLDKIWAEEALRRLNAYRAGKIGSIPMEEVFAPDDRRRPPASRTGLLD